MFSTFNSHHYVQLNTMIDSPRLFATNNLEQFLLKQIANMLKKLESVIVLMSLRSLGNLHTQFESLSGEYKFPLVSITILPRVYLLSGLVNCLRLQVSFSTENKSPAAPATYILLSCPILIYQIQPIPFIDISRSPIPLKFRTKICL